ncbi:MAG: PHP domain-containing protein [Lachnospiraceae bacterium]|nr:PHP domain-containing protein [Lachnospiraceae bacterium]
MMDLHMHSLYSEDGEFTPAQLVEQCGAQGITVMSITDHNSIRANSEAELLAKEHGICYIPGIEIDCTLEGVGFHVLGYCIDYHGEDFARIEENVVTQMVNTSAELMRKTQAMGFDITAEDVFAVSRTAYRPEIWTGDIFAEVLLGKPEFAEHPLLAPYRPGGSRSDNPFVNFYWDYYSQGKPCHVKIEYPPMREVIDIIHRNHGIAVLAHPGVNLKGREHLLEPLLELPFDGIEAFSSYHTTEQAAYYHEVSKTKKILTTCGSDYHGKTKPAVHLGGYATMKGVRLSETETSILRRKHLLPPH